MKLIKLGVLSLIFFSGIYSCSSVEPSLSESSPVAVDSIFPTWYQTSESAFDSVSYSGFATAIASDSIKAIERAEDQARINLERRIAQITEEIRTDMEESGSTDATNTDFIIILRTAHYAIEKEASSQQTLAKNIDGHYRGFASVSISREEIKSILEEGFTGHPRYWGAFSSSDSFKAFF